MIKEETIVHNVTEEVAVITEPEVKGDCKVHNVKPEEIVHKLPPKKIIRKWYEMIDKRV